jgi:arylsulfatase A-like enzyme
MTIPGLVGTLAIVVVAAACGSDSRPALVRVGEQPLMRLIKDEPYRLLDVSKLTRTIEIAVWPFDSGEWTVESSERTDGRSSRPIIVDETRLTIDRDVRLDTESIQAIELTTVGSGGLDARLFWTTENEKYAVERSATLASNQKPGAPEARYRADLAARPGWRGVVTGLRLVVKGHEGDHPQLAKLAGLRYTIRPSVLSRVQRTAWKAELGHEVRNGRLGMPGMAAEYRLLIAGPCEFRVSFGLPAGVPRPVTFRVVARDAEGRKTVLIERRIDPGEEGAERWWEERAALEQWRDRELWLSLETAAAPDFDPSRGIPLWANPEVVATGRKTDDRLNLLLISVDTLRPDHMSLYGYPVPTTPSIDEWARERAAVFSSVVAPAPWTLPSHVSLLSGLDAVRHGINHDAGGLGATASDDAITSLDLLAEILGRSGYATAAFTGGAYLHPRYGFAQGFDRYAYWPDRSLDDVEFETGVDLALQWMGKPRPEPSLFFLHTYAVHDPYRVRTPFFGRVAPQGMIPPDGRVALTSPKNKVENGFQQVNRFVFRPSRGAPTELEMTADDRRLVAAMYDSGIAYVDAQIGRLLEAMDELGAADRTVIVVTSDHGESLGERGQAGHIYLTDDNLLVPLVVFDPRGRGAAMRIDHQVRLTDVLPTVLDLLGVEHHQPTDGVSLVPTMKGRASPLPTLAWSYSAAPNRGLSLRVDNRLKFIVNNTAWAPVVGRRALFDLAADPGEIRDLSAQDVRTRDLYTAAMAYLRQHASGLRLRIRSGDGRIAGRLRGPAIRPLGTKAMNLEAPYIVWVEMGEAKFDVPAGEDFTLSFEKVFGKRLTVEGALHRDGGRYPFDVTFNVHHLEDAKGLVLANGRWRSVGRDVADDEIGFSVRWQGGAVVGGQPAFVADAELAEQLRALGYLD